MSDMQKRYIKQGNKSKTNINLSKYVFLDILINLSSMHYI